jgi:hypothetical protein
MRRAGAAATTSRQPRAVNCCTRVPAAVNVSATAPSPPVLTTVLNPPSVRARS